MSESLYVRRAAVLGAGVMGAQIAAHLVNAGVETLLFELPADGEDFNANAKQAIERLHKIQPRPLGLPTLGEQIVPANYDTDLDKLQTCDLIVEAIAERMDWKRDLYAKVAPYVRADAVLASNTSGLSINRLAEVLPEALRPNFCGVHFFNPPRYMPLVELIPGRETRSEILNQLEAFLVTTLGKGVVRAKDTPNFIANRVGVFSLLVSMYHAERLGIPFDVVDQLTGPAIGRPKSATFRTADVVGLDTFGHVVNGSAPLLDDDPWQSYLKLPVWMERLIEKGDLGPKTGAGVYRKDKSGIQVLEPASGEYRLADGKAAPEVLALLREKDPAVRLAAWRRPSIRKRSSYGQSIAISSITPRICWRALPITPGI
ncbi:3-hydroxyacyl-CoA dehydrogenase family protein [Alkalilimnicola ehrlichii]|uniref:3-hydroxyacyl-CoA dehydrogenase family protein n=1 Tax=Alkalilimnicola ehrlichii TaxID=351052 RepID=UPI002161BDA9|nr:3-hydroxyacyl-CoA dehydrogenase family protein [Alkalilimnicola ehrlichii]